MRSFHLAELLESAQAGIACGKRDNRGVAQLRLNNIQTNGAVRFDGHIRIPMNLVSEEFLLRPGDVLFNNTNSVELVGKTAYFRGFTEKITYSNHITRLRTNPDKLDSEYLALWLQYQWRMGIFERLCDRWVGQAAIQRNKLEAMEIQMPSLFADQRTIASRLNVQLTEVETAQGAAQAQLEDAMLLRSQWLANIFDCVADAPRKVLGDHAPTTSGTTPPRGDKRYWEPAEIPWVKTGEVSFGPITKTEESISKLALAECSLSLLPPKTVLVAMYGQGKTRGQSAILEMPATTNQACFAILPNPTWEPDFLFYWFVANYQKLRDLSDDRGGNQANLNGTLLRVMEIPAPELVRQLEIITRVKAALCGLDALQASVQTTLNELELLPQRILAQTFEN